MCKQNGGNPQLPTRRVSIEEARRLCHVPGILILWRPKANLDERAQYALVTEPANGGGK